MSNTYIDLQAGNRSQRRGQRNPRRIYAGDVVDRHAFSLHYTIESENRVSESVFVFALDEILNLESSLMATCSEAESEDNTLG